MPPMRNEQTLRRFYDAFAQLDADTMAACYAPAPVMMMMMMMMMIPVIRRDDDTG